MPINVLRLPGGEAALRRAWSVLVRRLPVLISVVLLLAIAWILASLTWAILPVPQTHTPIYTQSTTGTSRVFDVNRLIDQHLFGVAGGRNGGSSSAPETTLNLTLSGIAAGSNQSASRAIIASGASQQTYGIGDQVPGGAVIRQILADQVLLNFNGHVESLRLPKPAGPDQGAASSVAAPGSPPTVANQSPRAISMPEPANLGQLRHQVMQHPERLLDVVRAMPVMENGKFTGYRVYPAGNPRLFQQIGLKPGDIVTAVNGVSLDNPADSMRILGKLKTSDQVSLTFIRNGQQQTKVLDMQDNSQ